MYGNDPGLRADLIGRRIGYLVAVATDHRISTGIGISRAGDVAVRLPPRAWQRHFAGGGAEGHRWYDWALVVRHAVRMFGSGTSSGGRL